MSLLHRSASTESFRRASLTSTPRPSRPNSPPAAPSTILSPRRLSYNPLSDTKPIAPDIEPTHVSRSKRLAQVGIAVLYCLLAAGIVFGYAALKPVFLAEGVYSDACDASDLDDGDGEERGGCYKQELKLNFMFTLAAVSTNVAALPIGTILDRYGPRVSSLVGCVFLTLGAVCLSFAGDVAKVDLYIPGYLFLALGGPFVFISSFQLSNAFPERSGLVLALLTGAFDSSSALFLVYRLLYQGMNGDFKPKEFFLVYLVVPIGIAVAQLTVMPGSSYQTVDEAHRIPTEDRPNDIQDEETTTLLKPTSSNTNMSPGAKSDAAGALHGKSAWQQIKTPWFILITAFTIIQMTRINFFVATIRPQYEHLISHSAARRLNTFFDVALPLGGVASIPLVGALLDGLQTVTVLGLLVTTASIIGVLGLVPQSAAAGYGNILLFVLYRPFYYTAVSDYAAKVFGFETFGKVYGLIICLAGLGNFSQSALDRVTWSVFDGDYGPVNGLLLALGLGVGGALCAFVWWQGRTIGKGVEDDGSGETGGEGRA